MPTVSELTAATVDVLVSPRPGPGVCVDCFNFTRGFDRCFACASGQRRLQTVLPISYSVAHEPLHHMLADYKRATGFLAERATRILAATLWRFLAHHEACVACAADVARFDLVTTVPSSDVRRDEDHPLRRIVGELVAPTRQRHERLLRRTTIDVASRHFHPDRYEARRPLEGASILLIDDMWTSGASAQSAAAALQAAGARAVASVVIGRHVNREWYENDRRLNGISSPFDWSTCAHCSAATRPAPATAGPPTRSLETPLQQAA